MKYLVLLFSVTFYSFAGVSQSTVCTNPGQTPGTAFPICGTSVFTQNTVPPCAGALLPSPACKADQVRDINPFWYKFTCTKSGTLGFLITPKNLLSDYDWELYDITGKSPNAVYTDGNIVVSSNWSGEYGLTGASNAGTNLFVCAGAGKALFSKMPALIAGHDYLLLVSHFSNTQFGYDLSFGGGTAVINDTVAPRLQKAEPNCSADIINVKLAKKIKCTSIAADGSDFFITSGSSLSVSASSVDCSVRFDADSIQIKLNQPLSPGNYTLGVKKGSDGNTLLDYCDLAVATTDIATFTVLPVAYTPMDTLVPVTCAPGTLRLIFNKPIVCNSIAANGSDFRLTGSYAVAITGAKGTCSGTVANTTEIVLSLAQPLYRNGNFTLSLQTGSDGNTLLNECNAQTPAGSSLSFAVKDTVSADFSYTIQYGCVEDIVNFSHDGRNGVTKWKWNLDDNFSSQQQNARATYKIFDKKDIELSVTNGFCSDTSRQSFVLDNLLKADFLVLEDNCHSDPVLFKSNSTGKIVSHSWDFGDNFTGAGDTIRHIYAAPPRTTAYTVRYTVTDSYGCSKTTEKKVNIYVNCNIDVPTAFTPDADMKNDILYPLNAVKAEQLDFKVYNRWGQLIFHTKDWKKGWDGKYNGKPQPSGTYVWSLDYTHRETRQHVQKKGTSFLVR